MPRPDLDDWLPDPHIRTRHARTAAASEDALWAAARGLALRDTRRLGRLIGWRIPGLPEGCTYAQLFSHEPFSVLDEGRHHMLSGLCGRIWTLRRDYPRLGGPAAFRAWDESRTVRVLFAHWTEPHPSGATTLHSEARIHAVDTIAGVRLRALWAVVGPFERLIGAEPLELAAERAERD